MEDNELPLLRIDIEDLLAQNGFAHFEISEYIRSLSSGSRNLKPELANKLQQLSSDDKARIMALDKEYRRVFSELPQPTDGNLTYQLMLKAGLTEYEIESYNINTKNAEQHLTGKIGSVGIHILYRRALIKLLWNKESFNSETPSKMGRKEMEKNESF